MFSMTLPKRDERGFTLIELLVVIIIIGILAAIAIPLFLDQRKLAVDASVKSDVRNTLANIQTWMANGNTNTAAGSTGAYTAAGGKVATSGTNSIGVAVSATGAINICGYNAGGKVYTADTQAGSVGAFTYDSATGQFTRGTCTAGSTNGTYIAPPAGGVTSTYYQATLESGDSTNSMWSSGSTTGGGISSSQAHSGNNSWMQSYTGLQAYNNTIYQSLNNNNAWTAFSPSPALDTSKIFYNVTTWVYIAPNTAGAADGLTMQIRLGSSGSFTSYSVSTPAGATGWVKLYKRLSPSNAGPTSVLVYPTAASGGTGGNFYVDDLRITYDYDPT